MCYTGLSRTVKSASPTQLPVVPPASLAPFLVLCLAVYLEDTLFSVRPVQIFITTDLSPCLVFTDPILVWLARSSLGA